MATHAHHHQGTSTDIRPLAVSRLRAMFPSVDPVYLDAAVHSHPCKPALTLDKLIARVASKMLDANHGNWPTVLLKDIARIDHNTNTTSTPWAASRKGKGRASTIPSVGQSTILQVDETATRNACLITLNDMFPEVDLAHLRHALLSASNSYLYTSLSKLLFDPTLSPIDVLSPDQRTKQSGKGKRRLEPLPKRQHPGEITYADLIKDDKYTESALAMLCAQFPNVWKSSIKAVMAEHNNDYFTSIQAVKKMQDERPVNFFARTWAAFTQAFTTKTATSSPSTTSSKGDFSIPNYLSTLPNLSDFSTMLLYELQLHLATLTPPRSSALTQKRVETDSSSLKYEDMECGCCFSDMNVAQAVTCAEGCLFCKDCLARAVQESVYGQAPLRLYRFDSEDKNDFTGGEGTGIRCLSIEGCQASFSDKELRRSLPKELHAALETRLAQQNLQVLQACMNKSNGKRVRTVQCPFCPYIEVEDIPTLRKLWENTSTVTNMLIGLLSSIAVGLLYLAWMLGAIFLPDLLNTHTPWNVNMGDQSTRSMGEQQGPLYFAIQPIEGLKEISKRIQQVFDVSVTKHGGTVFRCKNVSKDQHKPASSSIASPAYIYSLLPPSPPSSQSTQPTPTLTNSCGRPSCRLCHKLHYPGHECQDSLSGLRLAKETAASNAIKRQCPECGLSFVKDNGCNKIVCRCGYTMCFLCRKGIGNERYAHFCQHPREPGMACTECTKCDLFKEEDVRLAVRKAVKQAEQDWLREHPEFDKAGTSKGQGSDIPSFTSEVLDKLELFTHITLEMLLSCR